MINFDIKVNLMMNELERQEHSFTKIFLLLYFLGLFGVNQLCAATELPIANKSKHYLEEENYQRNGERISELLESEVSGQHTYADSKLNENLNCKNVSKAMDTSVMNTQSFGKFDLNSKNNSSVREKRCAARNLLQKQRTPETNLKLENGLENSCCQTLDKILSDTFKLQNKCKCSNLANSLKLTRVNSQLSPKQQQGSNRIINLQKSPNTVSLKTDNNGIRLKAPTLKINNEIVSENVPQANKYLRNKVVKMSPEIREIDSNEMSKPLKNTASLPFETMTEGYVNKENLITKRDNLYSTTENGNKISQNDNSMDISQYNIKLEQIQDEINKLEKMLHESSAKDNEIVKNNAQTVDDLSGTFENTIDKPKEGNKFPAVNQLYFQRKKEMTEETTLHAIVNNDNNNFAIMKSNKKSTSETESINNIFSHNNIDIDSLFSKASDELDSSMDTLEEKVEKKLEENSNKSDEYTDKENGSEGDEERKENEKEGMEDTKGVVKLQQQENELQTDDKDNIGEKQNNEEIKADEGQNEHEKEGIEGVEEVKLQENELPADDKDSVGKKQNNEELEADEEQKGHEEGIEGKEEENENESENDVALNEQNADKGEEKKEENEIVRMEDETNEVKILQQQENKSQIDNRKSVEKLQNNEEIEPGNEKNANQNEEGKDENENEEKEDMKEVKILQQQKNELQTDSEESAGKNQNTEEIVAENKKETYEDGKEEENEKVGMDEEKKEEVKILQQQENEFQGDNKKNEEENWVDDKKSENTNNDENVKEVNFKEKPDENMQKETDYQKSSSLPDQEPTYGNELNHETIGGTQENDKLTFDENMEEDSVSSYNNKIKPDNLQNIKTHETEVYMHANIPVYSTSVVNDIKISQTKGNSTSVRSEFTDNKLGTYIPIDVSSTNKKPDESIFNTNENTLQNKFGKETDETKEQSSTNDEKVMDTIKETEEYSQMSEINNSEVFKSLKEGNGCRNIARNDEFDDPSIPSKFDVMLCTSPNPYQSLIEEYVTLKPENFMGFTNKDITTKKDMGEDRIIDNYVSKINNDENEDVHDTINNTDPYMFGNYEVHTSDNNSYTLNTQKPLQKESDIKYDDKDLNSVVPKSDSPEDVYVSRTDHSNDLHLPGYKELDENNGALLEQDNSDFGFTLSDTNNNDHSTQSSFIGSNYVALNNHPDNITDFINSSQGVSDNQESAQSTDDKISGIEGSLESNKVYDNMSTQIPEQYSHPSDENLSEANIDTLAHPEFDKTNESGNENHLNYPSSSTDTLTADTSSSKNQHVSEESPVQQPNISPDSFTNSGDLVEKYKNINNIEVDEDNENTKILNSYFTTVGTDSSELNLQNFSPQHEIENVKETSKTTETTNESKSDTLREQPDIVENLQPDNDDKGIVNVDDSYFTESHESNLANIKEEVVENHNNYQMNNEMTHDTSTTKNLFETVAVAYTNSNSDKFTEHDELKSNLDSSSNNLSREYENNITDNTNSENTKQMLLSTALPAYTDSDLTADFPELENEMANQVDKEMDKSDYTTNEKLEVSNKNFEDLNMISTTQKVLQELEKKLSIPLHEEQGITPQFEYTIENDYKTNLKKENTEHERENELRNVNESVTGQDDYNDQEIVKDEDLKGATSNFDQNSYKSSIEKEMTDEKENLATNSPEFLMRSLYNEDPNEINKASITDMPYPNTDLINESKLSQKEDDNIEPLNSIDPFQSKLIGMEPTRNSQGFEAILSLPVMIITNLDAPDSKFYMENNGRRVELDVKRTDHLLQQPIINPYYILTDKFNQNNVMNDNNYKRSIMSSINNELNINKDILKQNNNDEMYKRRYNMVKEPLKQYNNEIKMYTNNDNFFTSSPSRIEIPSKKRRDKSFNYDNHYSNMQPIMFLHNPYIRKKETHQENYGDIKFKENSTNIFHSVQSNVQKISNQTAFNNTNKTTEILNNKKSIQDDIKSIDLLNLSDSLITQEKTDTNNHQRKRQFVSNYPVMVDKDIYNKFVDVYDVSDKKDHNEFNSHTTNNVNSPQSKRSLLEKISGSLHGAHQKITEDKIPKDKNIIDVVYSSVKKIKKLFET